MRHKRLKAAGDLGSGYYHCVSRVVGRQFLLGEDEKTQFVAVLRRWEAFCGVRVLTYCVMSNHFHVLVEVPPRPVDLPSDEELIARVQAASGALAAGTLRQRLHRVSSQSSATTRNAARNVVREEVLRRMWDVSAFVKLVKQQFTQWFNGRHERRGTLWEQRFKSVLVEGPPTAAKGGERGEAVAGGGSALATMACYIDLNPVRAGMVGHPGDYRWCGYGAARGGDRRARAGLGLAVRALVPGTGQRPWTVIQTVYDVWLKQEGRERRDGNAKVTRRGVKKVGPDKPTLTEALRRRVRYFSDGGALGSREFVESVFAAHRGSFGEKRKTGARPLRQIKAPGLHVLRDLQVDVVGRKPSKRA